MTGPNKISRGGIMLELNRTNVGFKMRTVYFVDRPYDVEGVDWVNFPHLRNKLDVPGFVRHEEVNGIVDLKLGSEILWNNMASKCRSDIRKAEKDDITTHVNENFEEFIQLNSEFREEKKLPPVFQYYLKPPLPDFCALFTAKYQGEVIGGILFVKDDREMYGMLGASKRLQVEKESTALIARANRRLWWEAVNWGVAQGLEVMNMGNLPAKGTDAEREGVGEFKRRFGAEAVTCYGYRKIYTRKAQIVDKYRATISHFRQGSPTKTKAVSP
jgi:lipid II:glycine glycyltransferase (peptidoglycan interpeptide bridge formation enzyme)